MLIGICGAKQSGKSTFAQMLREELDVFGESYYITSFAHNLKRITASLSGCNIDDLESGEFKETELVPDYLVPFCDTNKPATYRNFLQYFGTNVMRECSPRVWIESAFSGLTHDDFIFSDVRFIDEADEIKKRGGIIIKIVRNPKDTLDNHSSEQGWKDIYEDILVPNGSGFEQLRERAEDIAELIHSGWIDDYIVNSEY